MKAKLDFRSKRTIIITAIIAALAVGAGIGAYFYAKGNNEASATTQNTDSSQTATDQAPTSDNNQGKSDSNANNGNENGGTATPTDGATGDNTGNDGAANNGANANGNDGNTGNDGATNNGNGGAANNGNAGNGVANNGNAGAGNAGAGAGDNDGDATTTTENIVVENPWESHATSWRPQTLNVSTPEVNVKDNNITAIKTSVTSTGYNTVSAGDEITYTIKVTNNNEETLNSLYITDEIPEGTEFVSIENDGKIVKEDKVVKSVYWNLWNLGITKGNSYSVSFKVKVKKDAKGIIKNVAIAEGKKTIDENGKDEPTKNPVLEEASKTSTIKRDEKEVKAPAKKGDKITYTISVKNSGEVEGTTSVKDADLAEILKDGKAELIGEIKAYENDEEKATISQDDLVNGYDATIPANTTYKVVYTIELKKIAGKVKNTATIGSGTSTDTTETTDLQVVKEVKKITRGEEELNFKAEDFKGVLEGDVITYTITVTNTGSVDLHDVVITETKEVTGDLNIGELKAGATVTKEVTYELQGDRDINDKREVTNVATAEGKTPDNEEVTSEPGTETTPVEKQIKDLSIEKKVSSDNENFAETARLGNGDTAYFQIKITNNSNVSMNVTLTDVLTSLKEDDTNADEDLVNSLKYKDGTAFKNGTTVKPGKAITLYAEKEITQTEVNEVKTLTNTIKATGTETNPEEGKDPETTNEGSDTATVEVKKPEISATKVSSTKGETVKPGDTITYTVTVTNKGETTGDTVVTDNLPSGVEYKSATVVEDGYKAEVARATESDGKVTITVKELSNEQGKNTVTVKIKTTVKDISDEDAENGVQIVNSIEVDGTTPEENGTTTDTVSKPVINVEKTSTVVSKAVNKGEQNQNVRPGDEITYTMTVSNSGLVDAEGIKIEDEIPAGVTLKSNGINVKVTDKDGNEVESKLGNVSKEEVNNSTTSTKLTWTNATLGSKETATITVKVTVNNLGEGNHSFNIRKNKVTAGKPGEEKEFEDPHEYTSVKPEITVTKTSDLNGKTIEPGKDVNYTITAENATDATDAGKVKISDKVDVTNLTDVSAQAVVTRKGAESSETTPITIAEDGKFEYEITLNPGDKVEVKISAKAKEIAESESDTYTVTNTASYKVDDEEEKPTDTVVITVFDKRLGLEVTKKVSTDNETFADSVKAGNGDTAYFKVEIKNTSNIPLKVTAQDIMTADGKTYNDNMTLYTNKACTTEFTESTLAKAGENNDKITLYTKQDIDQTIVNTKGKFENKVTATGTEANPEQGEEAKTVTEESNTAEVEVKKPNMKATKKSSSNGGEVKVGSTLTYTVTVENTGATTGNMVVRDQLPDEVTLQGTPVVKIGEATVAVSDDRKQITINVSELSNVQGENKVEVEIATTVNEIPEDKIKSGVEIINNIYANGNEETPADTTTDTGVKPVVEVEKVADKTEDAKPGDVIHYTVTVKNEGSMDLKDVDVTDTLTVDGKAKTLTLYKTYDASADGLKNQYKDATTKVDVDKGATVTLYTYYVVTKEDVANKATISNVAYAGNEDTEDTTDPVPTEVTDITLTKKAVEKQEDGTYTDIASDKKYSVGDTIYYAITVTNNSSESEVKDLKVVDNIPDGMDYVSSTPAGNKSGNKVEWTIENINKNGSTTIYVEGTIKEKALTKSEVVDPEENDGVVQIKSGRLSNTVTAADKTTTETVDVSKTIKPGIEVTKKVSKLNGEKVTLEEDQKLDVAKGDIVGYDIIVTNTGNVELDLKTVKVTDETRTVFKTETDAENGTNGIPAKQIINTEDATSNEKLGVGESKTYTVYYKVQASDVEVAGTSINNTAKAEATFTDDKGNKTTINGEDYETVKAAEAPSLKVEKTQSTDGNAEEVGYNDTLTYTIKVTNNGNIAQANVIVTDAMTGVKEGNKVTVTSVKVNGTAIPESTWKQSDGSIKIGTLDINDVATITATYKVKKEDMKATGDKIENTATAKSDKIPGGKSDKVDIDKGETNITVKKEAWLDGTKLTPNKSVTVKYGQTIEYKLTATNSGNNPGNVIIKDTIFKDLGDEVKLVGKIEVFKNGSKVAEISKDQLKTGYPVEDVEKGSPVTIRFTVKVQAYAGTHVNNQAKYKVEDEEEKSTDTIKTETKSDVAVVGTTTTVTGQKAILVLDYSGSMKYDLNGHMTLSGDANQKFEMMKKAVKEFLETYLDGNNEVMIIAYDNSATMKTNGFVKTFAAAYTNSIGRDTFGQNKNGKTNIISGLDMAYNNITAENTSVILMTDGVATHAYGSDGSYVDKGNGETYNEEAAQSTISAANKIKTDKNARLFTIGFDLKEDGAKTMLQRCATQATGTDTTQYYYPSSNGDKLKEAFSKIATAVTTNSDPVDLKDGDMTDGIVTITQGFKENQRVEIYKGEYVEGTTSNRVLNKSWNDFKNYTYTESATSTEIKFKVGKFMKNTSGISADDKLTFRFVDDI